MGGKFFVLEANAICANMVLSLRKAQHYVLLYLLDIMRIVVWHLLSLKLTSEQKGYNFVKDG